MTPFRFILLTLATYSLARVITTDDWPPSEWFRNAVERRMGPSSSWYTLVTCDWCASTYVGAAVFLTDHFLWQPPSWLLGFIAARAISGFIGTLVSFLTHDDER